MQLIELKPEFLKLIDANHYQLQSSIEGADGIWYLCPKCFEANKGRAGTHHIICWQPHVPQDVHPIPGRWKFEGSGFDNLSLIAGSSSILLTGGCEAHFFITNGEITLVKKLDKTNNISYFSIKSITHTE